jgi:putative transposase
LWPAPKVERFETDRGEVRRGVAGVGASQNRGVDARRRLPAVHPDRGAGLRRRGLLLPRGYRADRKSWAMLRRKVIHDPPTQRNRVWQTDFSEFETSAGGIWRICAVIDYATKYCLAITVTPTARGADALACLRLAVTEAERVLDLDGSACRSWPADGARAGRGNALHGARADRGGVGQRSCFRGEVFKTAFDGPDPLLRHVRTRVRSPQTNGVIERWFGTLKYEHYSRGVITDGDALDMEVHRFRII